MRKTMLVASVLSLAMGAEQLQAQASCKPEETFQDCWRRVAGGAGEGSPAEVSAALDETAHEAAEHVAAKSTGITSLGEGLTSSIGDFLPMFAGALGLTQTTTEDGGTAFEANPLIPLGANPQRIKLQALLRKPSLYQPVIDALPGASGSATRDTLTDELADFDDVRVSAVWNLENATFGRSFDEVRPYYNAYFAGIVQQALRTSETQRQLKKSLERLKDLLNAETTLGDPARAADPACADVEVQFELAPVDCFRPEMRDSLQAAVSRAALLVAARAQELHGALAEQGFYQFVDLVNNQPQLNVELAVDLRRDLVGPNQWALKLRYEGGFTNVNGLRSYCRGRGLSDSAPECLRSYLNAPGRRPSIKRGDRFSLSLDFARRADYALVLPSSGVALSLPGTWDLSGTAGFGRYVAVNDRGEEVGRIDLASSYVYHHDDPERQNRFVFTGTYTQRLNASLSVAAGVSYASRPEFLDDVDKKVSANFGLKYKFLRE
jgi:hypothetical protein